MSNKLSILGRYLGVGAEMTNGVFRFEITPYALHHLAADGTLDTYKPILFKPSSFFEEVTIFTTKLYPYKKFMLEQFSNEIYKGSEAIPYAHKGHLIKISEKGEMYVHIGREMSFSFWKKKGENEYETNTPLDQWAIADFCFRHHFAYGLEESDYIAK